jgi:hypothetical protein
MITSKQIIELVEIYSTGFKVRSTFVSVYENPTKSEIQEIISSTKKSQGESYLLSSLNLPVRFIADGRNQKIYMWDAYFSEHIKVLKLLGLPTSRTPYVMTGGCEITGSGLKIAWDNRPEKKEDPDFCKKSSSYGWEWLGNYINIKGYLPKLTKEEKT